MKKPRILLFDIEIAGQFGANAGFVICVAYKWLGEKKTRLISIRDFDKPFKANCTNDKPLIQAFSRELGKADSLVTWYGSKFDVPFIQTRRLIHKLSPLPRIPHIDGWRIAKYDLKFTRNSLDVVSRALGVHAKKTPLDLMEWMMAGAGRVSKIRTVEHHCVMDVDVLEETYLRIRPFARNLPNLTLLELKPYLGCPSCGSKHTQKAGLSACQLTIKQRHRCMKCGHNFYTAPSRRVGVQ